MAVADSDIKDEASLEIREPKQYKVIFHNDHITTYQFVIEVLKAIFGKSTSAAIELTRLVDIQGHAVVGVYSKEIAEVKVEETISVARHNNFPLVATFEEA